MKLSLLTPVACGLFHIVCSPSAAQAGPVSSPGPGSLDRKEILAEIRPRAEEQLGKPVEFVVKTMKIQDGFAFAELVAQRPGGKPIPLSETIFGPNEIYNFTIFALLQDTSSGWMLTEYDLSPQEPITRVWMQQYDLPASLF